MSKEKEIRDKAKALADCLSAKQSMDRLKVSIDFMKTSVIPLKIAAKYAPSDKDRSAAVDGLESIIDSYYECIYNFMNIMNEANDTAVIIRSLIAESENKEE